MTPRADKATSRRWLAQILFDDYRILPSSFISSCLLRHPPSSSAVFVVFWNTVGLFSLLAWTICCEFAPRRLFNSVGARIIFARQLFLLLLFNLLFG
jgi:hypothetical protein